MTSDRFERQLPAALIDLADERTPDYFNDILGRTARSRQRPAWSFPGRWFPMADIASRPAFMPRVPWRTIGVALVMLALLVAGAVFVGSRQTKLPPPFGVARNGLITYSANGDVYVVDVVTGTGTPVVTGPDGDTDPAFSRDGTKLAFIRTNLGASSPAKDIVVANADGSEPVVVTVTPIPGGPSLVEWANDSRSLLVGSPDGTAVWFFDATKAAEPRTVATDADMYLQPFQPPDGSAILIRRLTATGPTLVRLDLETLGETVLAKGTKDDDLGAARWSPDGSKVIYNSTPSDDADSQRLFIVNADGTDARQITDAPGTGFDIDAAWSPDGSRIAFTRYERVGSEWLVRPIGVYSVADRSVADVGPLARDTRAKDPLASDSTATSGEGFDFEWSPDGESLIAVPGEAASHPVVISARDGTWRNLAPVIQPGSTKQMWQRLAP